MEETVARLLSGEIARTRMLRNGNFSSRGCKKERISCFRRRRFSAVLFTISATGCSLIIVSNRLSPGYLSIFHGSKCVPIGAFSGGGWGRDDARVRTGYIPDTSDRFPTTRRRSTGFWMHTHSLCAVGRINLQELCGRHSVLRG